MIEKIQCSRCRNHKHVGDYQVTNTGKRLQTCDRCRDIKATRYRRQNTNNGPDFRKSGPEIMGDDKKYLHALRVAMNELGKI